jgi:putative transposase
VGGVVVGTVAFLLVRGVLRLVGLGPSPDAQDVEIAVLRHQLMVLRRQVIRPRYTPADRVVLATLAKLLPRPRWSVFLVTPATLLRWHRQLVARRWTYPHTGPSRSGLDAQVVELVLRLAGENPRWGYLRIVGEYGKLGVAVSATSVRRILRRHRVGPAPRRDGLSWSAFCEGPGPRRARRRLLHGGDDRPDPPVRAVRHRAGLPAGAPGRHHPRCPTGAWVTQAARNLLMDLDERADPWRYLIRDRDTKLTAAFDAVFTAAGIEVVRTPPRAPQANACAERWVRTVRAECLDWTLICTERHLHRMLTEYLQHYNTARPHRGINLQVPARSDGARVVPMPSAGIRGVERVDVLGGLIHEYRHAV